MRIFITLLVALPLLSLAQLPNLKKLNKDSLKKNLPVSNLKPTQDEVVSALREALSRGADSAVKFAGVADGYLKNDRLFIPWPQDAKEMKLKLQSLGMQEKIQTFEMSVNRAAEDAAKSAAPIFINAIKAMSIQDGFNILNGNDTAATHYLRVNAYTQLAETFRPIVRNAIEKYQVTANWTPLMTMYNKIPFVKKQNPDLEAYVTDKAIAGLMVLIADQEKKIRQDPMARTSELLKKVFGK